MEACPGGLCRAGFVRHPLLTANINCYPCGRLNQFACKTSVFWQLTEASSSKCKDCACEVNDKCFSYDMQTNTAELSGIQGDFTWVPHCASCDSVLVSPVAATCFGKTPCEVIRPQPIIEYCFSDLMISNYTCVAACVE